jgi:hypothetical protein
MKKIVIHITFFLLIGIISGCMGLGSKPSGLVPVHLTENSDSSVNASFDSSVENILSKKLPLELKLGARYEKIETTQYVLPAVATLIAQGKMKVVASQEKSADGSIKSSYSFELNN